MSEETKWTKGPYYADGPDMFGDWNILHEADLLAVAAVVTNLRYPEEVAANANLIAAAPDLYNGVNALLGLLTLVLSRDDLTSSVRDALTHSHRIDEARAALAKARGEPHPLPAVPEDPAPGEEGAA